VLGDGLHVGRAIRRPPISAFDRCRLPYTRIACDRSESELQSLPGRRGSGAAGRRTRQAEDRSLRCDNGPEFAGRTLDQWAYLNGIEIDFSRPGKPTDNAFCEAFNGRLRAECLNASWFLSMTDAIDRLEEWRCHYNPVS
jgi:transposase InsO family protein